MLLVLVKLKFNQVYIKININLICFFKAFLQIFLNIYYNIFSLLSNSTLQFYNGSILNKSICENETIFNNLFNTLCQNNGYSLPYCVDQSIYNTVCYNITPEIGLFLKNKSAINITIANEILNSFNTIEVFFIFNVNI